MAVLHSVLLKWSEICKVSGKQIGASFKHLTIVEFDDPDIFLEFIVLRLFILEPQSPFYKSWCS